MVSLSHLTKSTTWTRLGVWDGLADNEREKSEAEKNIPQIIAGV